MLLDLAKGIVTIKIVYYGPGFSGKTTNIEQIYKRINPERRSELVSLKTKGDRTLFFDFFSLEMGKIKGFLPKVNLYTVPGQVMYEANRKLVLTGADGVVFVADSQKECLAENVHSWNEMHRYLASFNPPLSNIPIVVQFNKQDISPVLPIEKLKETLNIEGENILCFPAVATEGKGVLETFKAILKLVVSNLIKKIK